MRHRYGDVEAQSMKPKRIRLGLRGQTVRSIISGQALGFACIVCLLWVDEAFHLPALVFGDSVGLGDWRESALESLLVCVVAVLTLRNSRRLLQRIRYLEGFTRMCSWCRKVKLQHSWIPVEDYLAREFDTQTSHGICENCAAEHFPDAQTQTPRD